MNLERKDIMIAIGVTIGAALLVLVLKGKGTGNSASSGGSVTGGVSDIMGGFQTAGTVYVPTDSYDITYNNLKDSSITYTTTTNNNQTTKTTTYAPVDSPVSMNNGSPINSPSGSGITISSSPVTSIVLPMPAPVPSPPMIQTGSNNVVNIPTVQTNTTPVMPKPVDPPPPPAAPSWEGSLMGGYHYATPARGWDNNSVVDNLKAHGYNSSFDARSHIAAAMNIQNYQGTAAQNIQMLGNLNSKGL